MTDSTPRISVERDESRSRYVILSDDAPAGFAAFRLGDDGRIVFTHTVLDPAFRGQGIGTALASEALADAARRGETIVPQCPFISKYLKEHDVAGAVIVWPDEDDAQDAATPGEPPA